MGASASGRETSRRGGGPSAAVRRHEAAIRGGGLAVIAISLIVIARRMPVGSAASDLEAWIGGLGPWGPAVFGLVYVTATVALLPASMLTLAAGAMFGPVVGTITVSLAATTGAALAFLIARHLARDAVVRLLGRSPRFEALDRAIGRGGWRVVALLRLSPAVPFNLQNYAYGLTGIGFWPCVLTSWVAMLPGTILYVWIGHAGRAGIEAAGGGRSRTPAEWGLIGVGLLATLAVTLLVTRLARQALREMPGVGPDPPTIEDRTEPLGWPWATTLTILLAALLAGLAAWTWIDPDGLAARARVSRLGAEAKPRAGRLDTQG